MSGEEPKRPRRAVGPVILMVIGALCLIAAVGIGGFTAFEYVDAQDRYEKIERAAGIDKMAPKSITVVEDVLVGLDVDWEALAAINSDVVAWVMIPETKINYPVVQTDNNDYYLDHLFDGSGSKVGAVFLDSGSSATLDGQNNVIYGHNMNDGSMFTDITRYIDQSYFDEHRTIYISTPQMNYQLQAEFALVCDGNTPIREFEFLDEDHFNDYAGSLLEMAEVSRIEDGQQINQLYCLATCSYQFRDARTILCASVVRSSEPQES